MSQDSMIVGLGNPGVEYESTRHNIGFLLIDLLARHFEIPLTVEKKREAELGRGQNLLLVKPRTYMNLSGRAVSACAGYYRVPKDRILVVYDDVDLPFGSMKLKPSGSAGGHNGVISIIQSLGHPDFARLRLGIAAETGRSDGQDMADYVLDRFNESERTLLPDILDRARGAVTLWRDQGLERAMNEINRRPHPPTSLPS